MATVFPELQLQSKTLTPLTVIVDAETITEKMLVPPQKLLSVPTFKLSQFDQTDLRGKFFSVMVTDLDAPSHLNPAFREFRMYLGVNCTITSDGYVSLRDDAFLCLSQWPKMTDLIEPDTGNHRLCVILGEQSGLICASSFDDRGNLRIWKAHSWMENNNVKPKYFGCITSCWGTKASRTEADFSSIVAPEDSSNQTSAGQ